MLRSHENSVAAWAFLVGVVLAIIIGLSTTFIGPLKTYGAPIYVILIILGIVVGSMITGGKDSQTFLLIGAILVIISKFGMESVRESLIGIGLVDVVSSAFSALLVLFIPATIIVAIKTVFAMAKL
jgi:hypothetical protein